MVRSYDHDVKNKILSVGSNYIVNVAMEPKFGNSIISIRLIIKTQKRYSTCLTKLVFKHKCYPLYHAKFFPMN